MKATGQITLTSVGHDDEIVTKGHKLIGTADMEQSAKDMISSVFGDTDGEHGSVDSRYIFTPNVLQMPHSFDTSNDNFSPSVAESLASYYLSAFKRRYP